MQGQSEPPLHGMGTLLDVETKEVFFPREMFLTVVTSICVFMFKIGMHCKTVIQVESQSGHSITSVESGYL